MFSDKLKEAMDSLNLSQADLCRKTGISKAAASQYLSSRNVPSLAKQESIAIAIGLPPDYFGQPIGKQMKRIERLSVDEVADIMGLSAPVIRNGLDDGNFPWGYSIRGTGEKRVYYINAKRFRETEGVEL